MKKTHAFTLIELLVVVAVIAVLMGILMPALKKAKEQGRSAACQGNMKGYALAVAMYAQDNGEKFPNHLNPYHYSPNKLPGETVNRHKLLRWCNREVNLRRRPELGSEFFKYLTDARGLICPTLKVLAKGKGVTISNNVSWEAESVPDYLYEPWYNYTMNAYLGPKELVAKVTQAKDPANLFVFADEGPYKVKDYNWRGLNDTSLIVIFKNEAEQAIKQKRNKRNVKPGPGGYEFVDIVAGFHSAPSGDVTGGKGTCTFADGHVAPVARDDSFSVAWPL